MGVFDTLKAAVGMKKKKKKYVMPEPKPGDVDYVAPEKPVAKPAVATKKPVKLKEAVQAQPKKEYVGKRLKKKKKTRQEMLKEMHGY